MAIKNNDQLFNSKHIRAAAKKWEKDPTLGGFRQSVKYDVVIEGKRYPPKPIAAIAYHLAGGPLMSPNEFAGAKEGKWHRQLQKAGGKIQVKNGGTHRTEKKVKPTKNGLGLLTRVDKDLENDLQAIILPATVPTTIIREILARLGQGKFRQLLLKKWGGKCSVTGLGRPEVLRASHIKRWADCIDTPRQRHDGENGLLLTANLDCLFEAGLISFDDAGHMLIDKQLRAEEARRELGIDESMKLRIKPSEKQKRYLYEHRIRHGFSKLQ